jgi:hypothetical protein
MRTMFIMFTMFRILESRVANANLGTVAPSILDSKKSDMGKNSLLKKVALNPGKV